MVECPERRSSRMMTTKREGGVAETAHNLVWSILVQNSPRNTCVATPSANFTDKLHQLRKLKAFRCYSRALLLKLLRPCDLVNMVVVPCGKVSEWNRPSTSNDGIWCLSNWHGVQ
jgi:hypothetical protein